MSKKNKLFIPERIKGNKCRIAEIQADECHAVYTMSGCVGEKCPDCVLDLKNIKEFKELMVCHLESS